MAKREKPAARKPASRSVPVAPPPAVEEWDLSDLEDHMVVLRCRPIDRGEPDDDFDDLLAGLTLPDFDLLEDLKPAELNPRTQATELAGLFMLLVGRSADLRNERRWHLVVPMLMGAVGLLMAASLPPIAA